MDRRQCEGYLEDEFFMSLAQDVLFYEEDLEEYNSFMFSYYQESLKHMEDYFI